MTETVNSEAAAKAAKDEARAASAQRLRLVLLAILLAGVIGLYAVGEREAAASVLSIFLTVIATNQLSPPSPGGEEGGSAP